MELELALIIVKELLAPNYLNPAQEMVFKAAWDGKSYPEIADAAGYDQNYIRGVGAQIWRMLATATEKRVSKNNFREIIELFAPPVVELPPQLTPQIDWGEARLLHRGYANDVSVFYGREWERQELSKWLMADRCRLVTILGMGGMGKTTLVIKLAQELQARADLAQERFRCILWRSLLNAPLPDELLPEIVRTLIDTLAIEADVERWRRNRERLPAGADWDGEIIPPTVASQIELLVEILGQHRCLIVLDNCESIFQGGVQVGQYRQGYADYGELFVTLGRIDHQSCLLLTSREKPTEIGQMEGVTAKVRTLMLPGLGAAGGQQIFVDRGCLPIDLTEWAEIDRYYGGNPLAFQLVAAAVKDIADGNVREILPHLRSAKSGFADIQILLEQQWERLTPAECQVMYWLAIQREPMTLSDLEVALHPTWNRQDDAGQINSSLLTAIQSLRRRCTIEILPGQIGQWSLQPVVMEYVTSIFVRQICTEIELQQPALLNTHALIQANHCEYIRQTQTRLIVEPIIDRLRSRIGGSLNIGAHLRQILTQWRKTKSLHPGYVAGNILNLLIQLKLDLTDLDCSELVVRQAYLVGTELPRVNFSRSHLVDCAFTQTFGSILSIAYSPDGKTLAASDSNGEIRIWRFSKGEAPPRTDRQFSIACSGHTNWVRTIKFSPDGRYLASASDDRTLKLWDWQNGTCLRTFGVGIQSFGLSFSPDGRYLASGSSDGQIYYWEVLTGNCVNQFFGHPDWSISLGFHPDGQRLVSGSANGEIQIWDLSSGKGELVGDRFAPSQSHQNWVTAVDYSPDGQTILSGSLDGMLRLWEVTGDRDRYRSIQSIGGAAAPLENRTAIWSAVFSPDGQYFASAGVDGIVRIWRTSDGECVQRLEGHTQLVWSVAFHPDGQRLVSGGEDRTLRIWQVSDGKCLQLLSGYTNWVHSIAWSPDSQSLITASCDAQIRGWDLHSETCAYQLVGHTQPTFAVAYDPQGKTFASGGDDRTIRIWNAADRTCKQILLGHTGGISALAYSPDGRYLVSGGIDRTICIWDLHQGRRIQVRHGHTDRICDLAYHPHGRSLAEPLPWRIASASEDGTVRIWDLNNPNSTQIITQHPNRVFAVAFDPLGAILASGGMDGSIVLWNLHTNEHCHTLTGYGGWILSLAYSADGRWLICGASDDKIYIWSMETGTCDKILTGHQSWVLAVAVSDCDRFIASVSQDETIRLWDLATGNLISTRRSIRPYEGMNIAELEGLTRSQLDELKNLGARD